MNLIPDITSARAKLNSHPLLNTEITNVSDLQIFMEAHCFAVWDFMCLAKTLQDMCCPSGTVWTPPKNPWISRMINQIITSEESDVDPSRTAISHFELYLKAMKEVGANTGSVTSLIANIQSNKKYSLNQLLLQIPAVPRRFCQSTFEVIYTGKPHLVAASFAYGRETIIPTMFKSLVTQFELTKVSTPNLSHYLDRHIELDGDEHGQMAETLVRELCEQTGDYFTAARECEQITLQSINSRIELWDGVQKTIAAIRQIKQQGPV